MHAAKHHSHDKAGQKRQEEEQLGQSVANWMEKAFLPKVVLQVPTLDVFPSTYAMPSTYDFSRPSVDPAVTRMAGFNYFQHDLPETTITSSPYVIFPNDKATSKDPTQLPGPGVIVWLTEPGTYQISATVAWTSAMQPKSTAVPLLADIVTPAGVSGPDSAVVASADDIPYDLQTHLVAAAGSATDGKLLWTSRADDLVSTAASMNSITPRALTPITSSGTAERWFPNFVTQTASTVLTIPEGQLGTLTLISASSIYFSRMPTPMLTSMNIIQLTRTGKPTPTPPLSLAEVGMPMGVAGGYMPLARRALGMMDAADAALLMPGMRRPCGAGGSGAGRRGWPRRGTDIDVFIAAQGKNVVTTTSAAYVAPVVIFSVMIAFAVVCGVMFMVNMSKTAKQRQAGDA
jgi:hypothetical protein